MSWSFGQLGLRMKDLEFDKTWEAEMGKQWESLWSSVFASFESESLNRKQVFGSKIQKLRNQKVQLSKRNIWVTQGVRCSLVTAMFSRIELYVMAIEPFEPQSQLTGLPTWSMENDGSSLHPKSGRVNQSAIPKMDLVRDISLNSQKAQKRRIKTSTQTSTNPTTKITIQNNQLK